MGSKEDRFDLSGPMHMMSQTGAGSSPTMNEIDWDNDGHRRCMAACMVQGTYVMQRDLTKHRRDTTALAPAWWESFGFRQYGVLMDEPHKNKFFKFVYGANQSVSAGAIFQNVPPPGARCHPSAPRYVVAFRGTMPEAHSTAECDRFAQARQLVEKLLDTIANGSATGSRTVWLAGHSLGASIALDVGRYIASSKGRSLPTFLFNPPLVSLARAISVLGLTEAEKGFLYAMNNFMKAGLGTVLRSHMKRREKLFEQLSTWAPQLYVHDRDPFCLGLIDHFEQKQKMQERFPGVAKKAMKLSYRDMLSYLLGKEKEWPHLLPSATLWKNSSVVDGPRDAHKLHHWWKPDDELKLSTLSVNCT